VTQLNINAGDTAWVLAATGFVTFMTPGLARFYGGNFFCLGLVSVLWAVVDAEPSNQFESFVT
jgi:ammonium transporter, Amt family